jgi:hypothetical protein
MDRPTLVPPSPGEQNLTPGEQRILALMEQGQQRLEQKLDAQGQQLLALTIKVDHEIGASKMRDRELALGLEKLRKEHQEQEVRLMAQIHTQVNILREDFNDRLNQLDTRLGVVEQVVQLNSEQLHQLDTKLGVVQQAVERRLES